MAAGGILLVGIAWALHEYTRKPPGLYLRLDFFPIPTAFAVLLAAAAAAVLLVAIDGRRARAVWFPAALAVYAALGFWMVYNSPNPQIDVYTVYRRALAALHAGHSPYGITFQNIYGHTGFYGAGVVHGSEVTFGFPYTPLALLMAIPGVVFGDFRYADVAAMVIGAAAIGYSGRSRVSLLAASLLLFTARGLFVIEQGWSEPFVICWLGLTVFAATRRRNTWLPLAGLLAVKQHMVLALPFSSWLRPEGSRRDGLRDAALAVGCAAAVTLPFFVADPPGFWRSVVTLQLSEPFRIDSLSVLVPLAKAGVTFSPAMLIAIPVVALLLSGRLAWTRAPRNAAGFAAALGFVLIAIFLVSKKAFCNYYFLVLACWCAAVAASDEDLVKW